MQRTHSPSLSTNLERSPELVVEQHRPTTALRIRHLSLESLYYLLMALLAILFLTPLIWMVVSSLKPDAEIMRIPPTFIPHDPQFQHYRDVFDIIPRFFYNSVKLAFLNVTFLLLVSSLAGYAFARIDFVGRDILFSLVLATAIVPSIVYLIPQYIVFRQIGWIDTHYPLWVPRVFTPVFATFLMRQSFKTMPQELEDAARVDGASTFTIYWRIMLPQVKPTLAAVGVFTFVESWNDLFGPLIFINSIQKQTLPVALALFQGEFFTQTSMLLTAATITVIPVLAIFFFAQKYFIQGITMTGLKG